MWSNRMKYLPLGLALLVLPPCAVAAYQLWLAHCCIMALSAG